MAIRGGHYLYLIYKKNGELNTPSSNKFIDIRQFTKKVILRQLQI